MLFISTEKMQNFLSFEVKKRKQLFYFAWTHSLLSSGQNVFVSTSEVQVLKKKIEKLKNKILKIFKIHIWNCHKKSNPFLVHVASMVLMKAASWKSRYQFGVLHSNEMTVPFSGEALKWKCISKFIYNMK